MAEVAYGIPLRNTSGIAVAYAIVDREDLDEISEFAWHINNSGYAARNGKKSLGEMRGCIPMHRQILGLAKGDGLHSDHINGNRLDNRRGNLRIVTQAQNNQNVRHRTGLSGHRNVYWHRASGLWHVQVVVARRWISGGYFRDLDDAAAAANRLRRKHLPFAAA